MAVRPIVKKYFWFKIGNGRKVAAWYDQWNPYGPIGNFVNHRTLYEAGYNGKEKLADVIDQHTWTWPQEWPTTFPFLTNYIVPSLNAGLDDRLLWRTDSGKLQDFSVRNVWQSIRSKGPVVEWYKLV